MRSDVLFFAIILTVSSCAHRNVPPLRLLGIWHSVSAGDTVDAVAERYGADPDEIAELNDLERYGPIDGREEIFIPKKGGKPPGTGAPPPSPITVSDPKKTVKGSRIDGTCDKEGSECLLWPAKGDLSAFFGVKNGKQHDGLDIAGKRGEKIVAADDGEVIYAGDKIKGYGNLVILRHDGGLITVYAHCDKILVNESDKVQRGQSIAEIGDTGSATVPHLHFEVRKGEQPVDPLLYLPPKE